LKKSEPFSMSISELDPPHGSSRLGGRELLRLRWRGLLALGLRLTRE